MSSLEQCVTHLRTLVSHRTVNPGGDEAALCEVLAKELRALRANEVEVKRHPRASGESAYVYAAFGTPTLLLNAHIDTVPANSGWTRDPFTAEVVGDRLYGLGSCDIKGAVACILTAIASSKGPRNLGVLFSGDEENGSSVMPQFLKSAAASSLRKAIVCEPTARTAGLAHRGVLAYRARYVGKGGHSSKADHMEKPVVELAKFALELDRIGREHLDKGPKGMKGLCMNVAQLTGGVAYNVVPDLGELSFSLRPAPGFDQAAFEAELEAARLRCHPKIELEVITSHPPFACGDEAGIRELVGDFASSYASLDFWTEAALLQNAGIDAVVLGPGDIAQAHTADEFVTLDDLSWGVAMFESLLARHG